MIPAIVTVDVEPDNVWANPYSTSMVNIKELRSFHVLCSEFGIRPTFLLTYSVANHPDAVRQVEALAASGTCEIGAHPHYWETPPFHPLDSRGATVGNAYDEDVLSAKLYNLTKILTSRFGNLISHRSGRWGFDDCQARLLMSNGYLVDSSVTPGLDWSDTGAPNYVGAPLQPHWLSRTEGHLLEVPCTIRPSRVAWQPSSKQIRRILRRFGWGPSWLRCSPRTSFATLRSISQWAWRERLPLVLMTHSSELAAAQSPMWRTSSELESHMATYRRLFCFWRQLEVKPMTLGEYARTQLSFVKTHQANAKPQ